MKRELSLRHDAFADTGWTVSTVAISFTIFVAPVQAQTGPEVELYGYVAPRCWVAKPAALPPAADAPASRPRVICNQSTPRLESNVRMLNPDGTIERVRSTAEGQPDSAQLSGRAALEILVSPQL